MLGQKTWADRMGPDKSLWSTLRQSMQSKFPMEVYAEYQVEGGMHG